MKPATRTGRARLLASPIALIVTWACLMTACFDPYADVKARLDPAERARFDRGARAAAPCAVCHDLAGEAVKIGPHLSGVGGRRAGAVPGFAYSDAMGASRVTWSPRTLDAFLAEPQRVVPGNRMVSPGVRDSSARADLVFFLIQAGTRPPRR